MDWGAVFLNRFDFKVRAAGRLSHPLSNAVFEIGPKTQPQQIKAGFGEGEQFRFAAGFLGRTQFKLTAVSLTDTGEANLNLLQQVAGPSGISVSDGALHCAGIFAPSGWPEQLRALADYRGNALFYLVQKEERSTLWSVFGPKGPMKQLFDPETADERRERTKSVLDTDTRLLSVGEQVWLDAFLKEQRLDPSDVLQVIHDSKGIYEIIELKGKAYIQRRVSQ